MFCKCEATDKCPWCGERSNFTPRGWVLHNVDGCGAGKGNKSNLKKSEEGLLYVVEFRCYRCGGPKRSFYSPTLGGWQPWEKAPSQP